MQRERYLVKSYGDNIQGTVVGLSKFLELCQSTNKNGMIVVPKIQDVRHTMLVPVLGEDAAKLLIRNRLLQINGATIELCASTTLRNHTRSGIYLALWGSKYTIDEIEQKCHYWQSVVLVTWLPEDSAEWELQNSVVKIFDDGRTV